MKLDCVLTAVNENPLYLELVPIFIKSWNKLYPDVDVKIILIAIWALILASLVIAFPAPFGEILPKLGMLLIVAHIVEYIVFYKNILAKKDGTFKAIILTLIFGLIYIKEKQN